MNVQPVSVGRKADARVKRRQAADIAFNRTHLPHMNNGEETAYPGFPTVASYSKGLHHDAFGDVIASDYAALKNAVTTGVPADFDAIPLGGPRHLTNPQAGLAFDLEGPDAQSVTIPPAPRIDSAQNSSEMAELYWMALLRDVNFTDFAADPMVAQAAASLTTEFTDFRGPKFGGVVTPATIFRGEYAGDLVGPYISQFLLKDVNYGSLTIEQRQTTVVGGVDYMTNFPSWLAVQNGADPGTPGTFDPTKHYIRNMRDLGQYVHVDALYEAYLNACLILLSMNTKFDQGNPYSGVPPSPNQDGFGTFGGPHILSLVTEVATRALKAVWFQKWFVHRRLRPEEFGGRIHNHKTGAKLYPMIDSEILNSSVLNEVFAKYGSYLLPMAFPEGSPIHPAYGAGHATVAGACVTILKAWFDESQPIPNPVVPNADGTALVPYVGSLLTVEGELNKVAANIGIGRNMAGVHWRTDYSESLKLGEAIAIGILQEQKITYNETSTFTLTKFDGTPITI